MNRIRYGRWLIVLFLAVVCLSPTAALASNKGIEVPCRVQPNLISVLVTDGAVNYGVLAVGATEDTTTTGLGDVQTATNNGDETVDFNINSTHALGGTQWTLVGTAGADTFTHSFSLNDGGSWTAMTTGYLPLATGVVATTGTVDFDLQVEMPTTITDYTQKTITVTVQAVSGG